MILQISCNWGIPIGSCWKYDNTIWEVTSKRGLTLIYLKSEQGEIALDAGVVKYFPEAECPGITAPKGLMWLPAIHYRGFRRNLMLEGTTDYGVLYPQSTSGVN